MSTHRCRGSNASCGDRGFRCDSCQRIRLLEGHLATMRNTASVARAAIIRCAEDTLWADDYTTVVDAIDHALEQTKVQP